MPGLCGTVSEIREGSVFCREREKERREENDGFQIESEKDDVVGLGRNFYGKFPVICSAYPHAGREYAHGSLGGAGKHSRQYAGSAAYKDFQKQAKGFFVNVHEVVNLPAKITLSQKGFRHF